MLDYNEAILKSTKCGRMSKFKFGCRVGQEGSKVNIVSKVLIKVKLKLVVMLKIKGVSQPKL